MCRSIQNVCTKIIKASYLRAAAKRHPRAVQALEDWIATVKAGHWRNPVELKRVFTSVDPVKVKSRRTVYVFNIRQNEFRLIAAIHFDREVVYTLRFLTHAEYDRATWKEEL